MSDNKPRASVPASAPASACNSNSEIDDLVASITSLKIPKTHAVVGLSNLIACNKQYKSLFVNRRLPDAGWSDIQIQHFLFLLSTLDTNNKLLVDEDSDVTDDNNTSSSSRWCGVGEREGRVYSSLVLNRHFGLSHGIGRSGDITEAQPKAVGSSVLARLTLFMVLDAMRRGSGLDAKTAAAHGILLPLCTGMSMSLVLSSLRTAAAAAEAAKTNGKSASDNDQQQVEQQNQNQQQKTIVLWSRIDQKSCFKAIQSAGLTCVVVPTKCQGDEVVTDLEAMKIAFQTYQHQILAVITTTSCFAPRVPDQVDEVAKLCQQNNVYHVINNAYGLQCAKTCKLINRACVIGRVDAIVSSTDKNFLVPVGGSIVVSPKEGIIQEIGKVYAGRASASPLVDLFITLLSMGLNGYKALLQKRIHLLPTFSQHLQAVAEKHGERLLHCPSNTISFGITIDGVAGRKFQSTESETEEEYIKSVSSDLSKFGAMLFNRCVSGTRVVPRGEIKKLSDGGGGVCEFKGFGSSVNEYPHAYMTAACAIGVTTGEINEFFSRLDKTLKEAIKKNQQKQKATAK